MSDALEVLRTRRSIRDYMKRPIARADLETIVDAARLAPTARNEQPWEFVVVTNRQSLERLGNICDHGRFIAQAAACVLVLCADTRYYLEDGSAATTNLMLAAHALGIGSCWVAGDKKAYARQVVELVGAPAAFRLISLVALGYSSAQGNSAPRVTKRPLQDLLHWDSF